MAAKMTIDPPMERRWGTRLALNRMVEVSRDHDTLGTACLEQVNLSGGFLRTNLRIRNLTRLWVHLPATIYSRATKVEAYVVRHAREGVGIEWCEFAPRGVISLVTSRQHPLRSDFTMLAGRKAPL